MKKLFCWFLSWLLCCSPALAGAHFDNAGNALGVGTGEGLEKDLGGDIGPRVTNFGSWAVACWFKIDGTGSDQVLVESSTTGVLDFAVLYVQGSSGKLTFDARGARAQHDTVVTTGVWHSAVAVRIASNDTRIYLDGVRGNDDATDSEQDDASRIVLGRHHSGAVKASALIGDLSHVVFWKGYAWTNADGLAWHSGQSPFHIGVGKIWNYWPLNGDGPLATRARSIAGVGDELAPVDDTQEKTDSYPIRRQGVQYSRADRLWIFLSRAFSDPRCYRRERYALAA